jgi:hypothetical protein
MHTITANGLNRSKTVDKTLEAIASCMFGTLHTQDAGKVLDQAISILNKLHAQKIPTLDTALCENAASFVSKFSSDGERNQTGANQNGANREISFEAFTHQIILALLSHDLSTTPTESARKARTELASALVGSSVVSNESRVLLASIFDAWLKSERSKLLRDEITRALEVNKKNM